ncbi:hypothetical protein Cgig2_029750 [Carnegiea gigantea]|uniref:Uncharacterized protein n=1 Tax=Carnegiea gigantea TaxID=171969 RepID=A0A9Q1K239_9CARY|nr:hypothetical protein Cgig2_029750 [Carnegiea gigantea]
MKSTDRQPELIREFEYELTPRYTPHIEPTPSKESHGNGSMGSSKDYMMRFNHKAILIPDLQDGVLYTTFLNGLLPRRFKFSLAESKDKGSPTDKRHRKDDERIGHFHTMPRDILMEIKGNTMLGCPMLVDILAKFRIKNKYYEYHEDHGHSNA